MTDDMGVWVVPAGEVTENGVRTVRYGVADTKDGAAFAGMGGDTPLAGVAVTVGGSAEWRWAVSKPGEPEDWLRHGTAPSENAARARIGEAAAEWFSQNPPSTRAGV